MTDPASDVPLHLLAIDHRSSLLRGMRPLAALPSSELPRAMASLKELVLDGLLLALEQGAPRPPAGLLVDAEYGADAARRARAAGLHVALPLERSGQRELTVDAAGRIPDLVEELDPTFLKVLVRYNPGGDAAMNARQRRTLRDLAELVALTGRPLMLEVLVPAEAAQLADVGGDERRYDDELRPGLTVAAVTELRDAGITPAVWKIEGQPTAADCASIAAAATDSGRLDSRLVVLGRGADAGRVEAWLRTAGQVDGFAGFAVGRTIWWESVERTLTGELGRAAAVAEVAARYRRIVDVHAGVEV